MKYNFDEVIERRGSCCLKWDDTHKIFGVEDILPLWVADMDFQAPPEVMEALEKKVGHGIFGYAGVSTGYYRAQVHWLKKRFGWEIEENWITVSPGVIPALITAIKTFTSPGDQVLLQPPVYYPFFGCVENNNRRVVLNPLIQAEGRYRMDFDDLEKKLKEVKVLVLCSPHNPVGRVWEEEELRRVGELCRKHKVLVVSDDIHSDLVLKGHHTPFPLLSHEDSQNSIILTATSKTFNLAGLQTSNTIIPNPELRRRFRHSQQCSGFSRPNIFGQAAVEAAYTYGEGWLEELLLYVQGNLDFFLDYVRGHMPILKIIPPEGTYLIWVDCRGLGLNDKELRDFLLHKARVGFNSGHPFGPGGEGFVRVNIACPRATLSEALKRLKDALKSEGLIS
jgi:cysteine-S-conjugate beta-lyase